MNNKTAKKLRKAARHLSNKTDGEIENRFVYKEMKKLFGKMSKKDKEKLAKVKKI